MPDIKPVPGDQIQVQIYPTPTSPLQYVLATVAELQDRRVSVCLKGVPELRGEIDDFYGTYIWDPKQNKWIVKTTIAGPPISRTGEVVCHPVSAPPS